jgi:L-threonylcarbamoyladenylate synthase
VYGLGADALNAAAVEKIYVAKGRPSDNPLIVHISNQSQLENMTITPTEAEQHLMDTFWPGPLTMVLQANTQVVPAVVRAHLDTVAVRQPNHPLALALIDACATPLAAPSANQSGKPSPTTAEHVMNDLFGKIAAVLDGGHSSVGIESTVVQLKGKTLYILRPGSITEVELESALSKFDIKVEQVDAENHLQFEEKNTPRSPGVKYAHYAPKGEMTVIYANQPETRSRWICEQLIAAKDSGHRTGVFTFDEYAMNYRSAADVIVSAGKWDDPTTIARHLYDGLRQFDQQNVTRIFAEACPFEGIGNAVMNRLLKAAAQQWIHLDLK